MIKLSIVGQAFVISTDIKLSDLDKAQKFAPKALVLRDEDKEPLFAVSKGKTASLNAVGATFATKDPDGNAQITLPIPTEVCPDSREKWAKDNYGLALDMLDKTLSQVAAGLATVDGTIGRVFAEMEVK